MKKLLQIDFSFNGPFGQEMADSLKDLAHSIVKEPGLLWKIWTENEKTQEAGGIYLFDNEENARAYLKMHTARLKSFGVAKVNAKIFDINHSLSTITQAPLSQA